MEPIRVPAEVWNFHIGGYQVCEKWLKDRQAKGGKNPRPGRILADEDIALPEDRRRPQRDHPYHGRDRRGHRSPRRLARRIRYCLE